jgi:predicted amidohydrolase YtcJ
MAGIKYIWILSLACLVISCGQNMVKADFIIHNAKVYSVDEDFNVFESVVIKDGKILDLGTSKDMLDKYQVDDIIDANGKPVYPGFIDAHCHFYGYGLGKLTYANLNGTASFDEIVEILRKHNEVNDPQWILGRGWDQNDWENTSMPDKSLLDGLFDDKPVLLIRIDGHAALLNQKALDVMEFDSETVIDGGELIERDGELSGLLLENAVDSVRHTVPQLSREQKERALLISQGDCFQYGLTTVSDAGLKKETIELIDSMHKDGVLKMQIYAMLEPSDENLKSFVQNGPYITDRLNVRSIKLYADGALGSRGACMHEPYSDDPHNSGFIINSEDFYNRVCSIALSNGYQVNTHAIGDKGNSMMLHIYGDYLKEKNDLRWRIEHAQIVNPEDRSLFSKYSIIPSVQATHATSDMYWAEERVGEQRMDGAYAYKSLLKQNGWLANGTDFPIEHISPLYTFYAATARKDLKGWPKTGFRVKEALTREEALRSITIWAAKAGFEETGKGSLEIGKKADLVILDKDLMNIPLEEIPDLMVSMTLIAGERVFSHPD